MPILSYQSDVTKSVCSCAIHAWTLPFSKLRTLIGDHTISEQICKQAPDDDNYSTKMYFSMCRSHLHSIKGFACILIHLGTFFLLMKSIGFTIQKHQNWKDFFSSEIMNLSFFSVSPSNFGKGYSRCRLDLGIRGPSYPK